MIIIDEHNKDEFCNLHKRIILIEYDNVLTNKNWGAKRIKPNLGGSEFLYRIKNKDFSIVVVSVRTINDKFLQFLKENEYYTYIDGVTNLLIPHTAYVSVRAIKADKTYERAWKKIEKL